MKWSPFGERLPPTATKKAGWMRIQANPCQNRRTGKRRGADIHNEVASVGASSQSAAMAPAAGPQVSSVLVCSLPKSATHMLISEFADLEIGRAENAIAPAATVRNISAGHGHHRRLRGQPTGIKCKGPASDQEASSFGAPWRGNRSRFVMNLNFWI
jgi:hypothetical protein